MADEFIQALRDAKASDAGIPFPPVLTGMEGIGPKHPADSFTPNFGETQFAAPGDNGSIPSNQTAEPTVDLDLCNNGVIVRVKGEVIKGG